MPTGKEVGSHLFPIWSIDKSFECSESEMSLVSFPSVLELEYRKVSLPPGQNQSACRGLRLCRPPHCLRPALLGLLLLTATAYLEKATVLNNGMLRAESWQFCSSKRFLFRKLGTNAFQHLKIKFILPQTYKSRVLKARLEIIHFT